MNAFLKPTLCALQLPMMSKYRIDLDLKGGKASYSWVYSFIDLILHKQSTHTYCVTSVILCLNLIYIRIKYIVYLCVCVCVCRYFIGIPIFVYLSTSVYFRRRIDWYQYIINTLVCFIWLGGLVSSVCTYKCSKSTSIVFCKS